MQRHRGGETRALQRGAPGWPAGIVGGEAGVPGGAGGGVWPSPEGGRSPAASSVGQTVTERGGRTAPLSSPRRAWRAPPRPLIWPEEERGSRLRGAAQPELGRPGWC